MRNRFDLIVPDPFVNLCKSANAPKNLSAPSRESRKTEDKQLNWSVSMILQSLEPLGIKSIVLFQEFTFDRTNC